MAKHWFLSNMAILRENWSFIFQLKICEMPKSPLTFLFDEKNQWIRKKNPRNPTLFFQLLTFSFDEKNNEIWKNHVKSQFDLFIWRKKIVIMVKKNLRNHNLSILSFYFDEKNQWIWQKNSAKSQSINFNLFIWRKKMWNYKTQNLSRCFSVYHSQSLL